MNIKIDIQNFWNKKPCGTFGCLPDNFDKQYFEKIRKRRYNLESFIFDIAEFNNSKDKKILEIGCGIGMDGLEFAKNGAIYTGIDLSDTSIKMCQKHFELYNQKGDIINTDVENLPFEDNAFDIIYSWGVLHHIPDMQRGIDEVYRVLKPQGKIIIMVYNRYSLVGLQLYIIHGLLKLKPLISWDKLFFNHHESIATKALTDKEARNLFKKFSNLEIENIVTPYDVRIGKNKFMSKWFMKLIPNRFGFFKIIKGKKN